MTENTMTTPEAAPQMTAKESKAHAKAAKAHAKALRPWYKKPSRIVPLGVAGLLVVVVASSAGGSSTDTPSADPAPVSASQEQAAETDAVTADLAGIGDAVRDGKFEFVVTEVNDGVASVGDEFLGSEAQGEYTLVTLTVENIGDEPQMFDDSNVTGLDSKGRELASDGEAGLYANEDTSGFLNELNPGNSATAIVVFDVAKGQTLDQIIAKDSMFSDGATVALN